MNTKYLLTLLFITAGTFLNAQTIAVKSPDAKIECTVTNAENLNYSVTYTGRVIINTSQFGFDFKDELPMTGNFIILDQSVKNFSETWIPVVKSKHEQIENNYNELQLVMKERSGAMRKIEFFVRAYNDGIAFRYKLSRAGKVGDRQIIKELTTFNIPG